MLNFGKFGRDEVSGIDANDLSARVGKFGRMKECNLRGTVSMVIEVISRAVSDKRSWET
jgi:hypothetical protein